MSEPLHDPTPEDVGPDEPIPLALPYVIQDGQKRIFGCLPPRPNFQAVPRWANVMPVIPRARWKETNPDNFGARVLDQDGHGSCVGHGSTTAYEMAWLRAGGPPVAFAACYVYGQINGGRDQGAIVGDAMRELIDKGVCTEAMVPPGKIYSRSFPAGADAEAAKYKVREAYSCATYDEICTALQMGWTVSYGIMVGNNFGDLDSNGIAPLPRGGGGGHCLCTYCLKNIGGKWIIWTRNSWNTSYGQNGECGITEQHMDRPGQIDAFAIQAVVPDAMTDLPPVATS